MVSEKLKFGWRDFGEPPAKCAVCLCILPPLLDYNVIQGLKYKVNPSYAISWKVSKVGILTKCKHKILQNNI